VAVALATLDLFSGIGGFARGFEATGSIETTCFVEQDPYCQAVLRHHWPDVPILGDIRDVKGCELPIQPDVICGGFPCQPFSQAGKQLAQDDPRHLWPEMFRLIRECRPAWVVGENVAGLIKLGLDEVLSDLEGEGYATRTFNLPACAVGAPHIRQRLWIIAHADSQGEPDKPFDDGAGSGQLGFGFGGSEAPSHGANPNDHGPRRAEKHQQDAQHGEAQLRDKQVRELGQVGQDVADTDNADRRRGTERRQVGDGELELHGEERPAKDVADTKRPRTGVEAHRGGRQERESPNTLKPKILPQGNGPGSPERASASGNDGARRPKDYWQSEPPVGRLADGIPNRVSQLRALGNTIIPQIAEEIGHAIVAATKG
jgi:DNA (cytosine-5)-methyltransferase 1